MKRLLCPVLPKPGSPAHLPESEARHALQVFRLRDGEIIEAIDGKGHAVLAELRVRGKTEALLEYKGPVVEDARSSIPLTLEMSVLKGDAMEWAVEKAVELGVKEFVPILTDHTVVQTHKKGPEAFQERWQKIADQSLKQCGRLDRMTVALPLSLGELLQRSQPEVLAPRLWCDEATRQETPFLMNWINSQNTPLSSIRVLIGPEGGWSDAERELLSRSKTQRVSLGPLVLRGETAAIFSVSLAGAYFRATHLDKVSLIKGN